MNFEEMSTDELWSVLPETEGLEKGQLLLNLMGRSEDKHGHETAVTLAQEAGEIFLALGHNREYAFAKAYEGDSHTKLENYEVAKECYSTAKSNLDEFVDSESLAQIYLNLGNVYKYEHNEFDAAINYSEAVRLFYSAEDFENAALAQDNLVEVSATYGENDVLIKLAHQQYEIAKKSGVPHSLMKALSKLAFVYDRNGDFDTAVKFASDALGIAKTCSCPRCVPDAHLELAGIYIHFDKMKKGRQHLITAKELFKDARYTYPQILCDAYFGASYVDSNPKKAKKILKEALNIAEHMDFKIPYLKAGKHLAQLYVDQGKSPKAVDLYSKLLKSIDPGTFKRFASTFSLSLAELFEESGETTKAKKNLI